MTTPLQISLTFIVLAAGLHTVSAFAQQLQLSDAEIQKIASDKYASGELPLGDYHYVTDSPRKGYVYMCFVPQGGGGAQQEGDWIHGETWNFMQKFSTQGKFYWQQAYFNQSLSDDERILSGNGLPVNFPTGIFPIQPSDPASRYDRNPNSILAQNVREILPRQPTYSDTPYCIGMQVGIMLNGVALFNSFDAGMRDAAAHEVQDLCDGHPEPHGRYHYHSLSACLRKTDVKTVIGYAFDGFPITGPMVTDKTYLTTEDLDECHGITSSILQDGKPVTTYHYVMTYDFPYSVSCFRSRPISVGPSNMMGGQKTDNFSNHFPSHQPPTEAVEACQNLTEGSLCSFVTERSQHISGICHKPPAMNITACIPNF